MRCLCSQDPIPSSRKQSEAQHAPSADACTPSALRATARGAAARRVTPRPTTTLLRAASPISLQTPPQAPHARVSAPTHASAIIHWSSSGRRVDRCSRCGCDEKRSPVLLTHASQVTAAPAQHQLRIPSTEGNRRRVRWSVRLRTARIERSRRSGRTATTATAAGPPHTRAARGVRRPRHERRTHHPPHTRVHPSIGPPGTPTGRGARRRDRVTIHPG